MLDLRPRSLSSTTHLRLIGPHAVVHVVTTWRGDIVRMISARRATTVERRIYEEAHERTKARYRGSRREARRRHDLTDVPEITDWSGAVMGMFYRPAKRPVTMRLDEDVVEWLKGFGPGYQTKANLLLRHAMLNSRGKKSAAQG
jgi:uncharacterized protein (DUF4415 family)